MLSLLYGCPTLTSIHDYWKNHSFDQTDLHRQTDVSTFFFFLKIYSLGCGGPLLLHTGFLVAESGDYSSVAVLGPLPAGASPAAEHRL